MRPGFKLPCPGHPLQFLFCPVKLAMKGTTSFRKALAQRPLFALLAAPLQSVIEAVNIKE